MKFSSINWTNEFFRPNTEMNIIFILLQSCNSQPLTSFFCLRFLASHQKFDVKRSEEEEVKIKVNKFVFRSNKLAQ